MVAVVAFGVGPVNAHIDGDPVALDQSGGKAPHEVGALAVIEFVRQADNDLPRCDAVAPVLGGLGFVPQTVALVRPVGRIGGSEKFGMNDTPAAPPVVVSDAVAVVGAATGGTIGGCRYGGAPVGT